MPMFNKNQTQTRSAFEALVDREIEFTAEKKRIVADLQKAERSAGEAFAPGATQDDATLMAVVRLEARLSGVNMAIKSVRDGRLEAFRTDNAQEVASLRKEAATKHKELEAIQARTSKALAELSKAEGIAYDEGILYKQQLTHAEFARPRSLVLKLEIGALEDRATELENATLPPAGRLQLDGATSTAEIVKAVLLAKSSGPDAATVDRWLAAVEAEAQRRNKPTADHPRFVHIVWNGGFIDSESHVSVRALMRETFDGEGQPNGFDGASGTFRASEADFVYHVEPEVAGYAFV